MGAVEGQPVREEVGVEHRQQEVEGLLAVQEVPLVGLVVAQGPAAEADNHRSHEDPLSLEEVRHRPAGALHMPLLDIRLLMSRGTEPLQRQANMERVGFSRSAKFNGFAAG